MARIFLFLTTIFKGGKIFRDLIKELVLELKSIFNKTEKLFG